MLKGKKVIFRKLKVSDAKDCLRFLQEPENELLLATSGKDLTLEQEKEWIKEGHKGKTSRTFGICDTRGNLVGNISLRNINPIVRKSKLCILIGKKYQNKGFGQDAICTLLNHSFKDLGLNRVELAVCANNKRAMKAYKNAGFKKEGVKREGTIKQGKFIDVVIMGILKKDWQKSGGNKL